MPGRGVGQASLLHGTPVGDFPALLILPTEGNRRESKTLKEAQGVILKKKQNIFSNVLLGGLSYSSLG